MITVVVVLADISERNGVIKNHKEPKAEKASEFISGVYSTVLSYINGSWY